MYVTIIHIAAWMHVCFALGILFDPNAVKITSISALHIPNHLLAAAAFAFAALLSVYSVMFFRGQGIRRDIWLRAFFAVPQQILLVISAIGEVIAFAKGKYPDGYTPSSSWFIFADQSVYTIIAMIHSYSVIQEFCRAVKFKDE